MGLKRHQTVIGFTIQLIGLVAGILIIGFIILLMGKPLIQILSTAVKGS
jgi:hypothetical protein